MQIIRSHKELEVYQLSLKSSMDIFNLTRSFPKDEIFSLTSQIRRSSRSISANIAEAFRKRRYEKAFVAKLSDSEAEAAETQVWLDYSLECGYITDSVHQKLYNDYDNVIGKIVNMINHPEKWSIWSPLLLFSLSLSILPHLHLYYPVIYLNFFDIVTGKRTA
jgi:four helix bundle protein